MAPRGDRARRIMEELMGPQDSLTPSASFVDDLGMDSLDIVEMVMMLEEEFEIDIEDDVAEKWKNYGDLLKYLDSLDLTAAREKVKSAASGSK